MLTGIGLVSWRIGYAKQAQRDAKKISASGLRQKVENLLEILEKDPFQYPTPYEKLTGDLTGSYSRRIDIKHRLVYQLIEDENTVKIISMWTYYE